MTPTLAIPALMKGNATSRPRALHFALVGAVLLAGCAPGRASTAPSGDHPSRGSRSCRELADVPLAGRPFDLLQGRLLLRPPAGAHEERADPPTGVGDTAASRDAGEAQVRIGFDGILIVVSELFRLAGPRLEDDAVAYSSRWKLPTRTTPLLPHGARGIEIAAESVLPRDTADSHSEGVPLDFVASALFAYPDGTALEVRVDAEPRVVRDDLASCVALATRIFETVGAGPRRLLLSAGQRREPGFTTGEELVFDVPAGFAVTAGRGSLGVHKIVPFGRSEPPGLRVDFAGSADTQYLPDGSLPSYGESLEWSGPCEVRPMGKDREGVVIEAPRHEPWDVRQLDASASIFAPDVSSCEEMKRIAASLVARATSSGKSGQP